MPDLHVLTEETLSYWVGESLSRNLVSEFNGKRLLIVRNHDELTRWMRSEADRLHRLGLKTREIGAELRHSMNYTPRGARKLLSEGEV